MQEGRVAIVRRVEDGAWKSLDCRRRGEMEQTTRVGNFRQNGRSNRESLLSFPWVKIRLDDSD